jgi:hypothetical protein
MEYVPQMAYRPYLYGFSGRCLCGKDLSHIHCQLDELYEFRSWIDGRVLYDYDEEVRGLQPPTWCRVQ